MTGFADSPGTADILSTLLSTRLELASFSLDTSTGLMLINGLAPNAFYRASVVQAVVAAWWDVLGLSIIFFFGGMAALVYRSSCKSTGDWEIGEHRNKPFVRFAVAAVLAVLVAALAYEILLFMKLVLLPSAFAANSSSLVSTVNDFGVAYAEYGWYAILAAPAATFVCLASDRSESKAGPKAGSNGEPETRELLHLALLALPSFAITHTVIRYWIEGMPSVGALLLSLVVPVFTLTVLTLFYQQVCPSWIQAATRRSLSDLPGSPDKQQIYGREAGRGSGSKERDTDTPGEKIPDADLPSDNTDIRSTSSDAGSRFNSDSVKVDDEDDKRAAGVSDSEKQGAGVVAEPDDTEKGGNLR